MAPIRSQPRCKGPRLDPFPHNIITDGFEFLEVLDCDARHGVIIKARRKDRLYAIKLFITEQAEDLDDQVIDEEENVEGKKEEEEEEKEEEASVCCCVFDWYFDAFQKECRAFGRLQEVGCEYLAVKAHGWISVSSDDIMDKLPCARQRTRFHTLTLRNVKEPIMGIVKDWVEMAGYHDKHLRPLYDRLYQIFQIPQMIENLHEMHKHGIVVRDIRSDQYVNGVLVDLSCSSTAPHPSGPILPGMNPEYRVRWTFASLAAWDLFAFQWFIIESWNNDYENLVKLLGKPQGMPDFCPFRAYVAPYRTRDDRARANQARATRPYGPFLPMLNLFGQEVYVVEPARWDPLEYIKNGYLDNDGKETLPIREKADRGSVEQIVEKVKKG